MNNSLDACVPLPRLCKNAEEVRKQLAQKESPEQWDDMSRVIQQSINAISPKDTIFRLPKGLIDNIRGLLLDESEQTLEFRKDALALIGPIAFIKKDTTEQVDATILKDALNIPSAEDTETTAHDFFQKYATLLGYDLNEKEKTNAETPYTELPKKTQLSIELLIDKTPEKRVGEIVATKKTYERMKASTVNSPEKINIIKNRVELLINAAAIAVFSSKQKNKIFLDLDLSGTIEGLLTNTPKNERDTVLSALINKTDKGREYINTQAKLYELMEKGWEESLASAINQTNAGKEFIQTPQNLQLILDKGIDKALAAAIMLQGSPDAVTFVNKEAILQQIIKEGMINTFQCAQYVSEKAESLITNSPELADKCETNFKNKLIIFEKQEGKA